MHRSRAGVVRNSVGKRAVWVGLLLLLAAPMATAKERVGQSGYYRSPALHGNTLVFVAEGDLWKTDLDSGTTQRLTTHAAAEIGPKIDPNGLSVAFTARYEGPREIYTMPLDGGRPRRLTYGLERASVAGYHPDGALMYSTRRYSPVGNAQLVLRRRTDGADVRIPLAQADQGAFRADGKVLYFTRLPFQGSNCKRYKGGTAQNLWRFDMDAGAEATPLTGDYAGTSKNPMVWKDRLFFLSDRDGTMNLWSMKPDGPDRDLKQVTKRTIFDIQSASLHNGRIAYRVGADIRLLDLASGTDEEVAIRFTSDADHTREKWIKDPFKFMTSAHPSPDGKQVALTSRGRIFVAPVGKGRFIEVPQQKGARFRDARFDDTGTKLHYFSDETDEVELWSRPVTGAGRPEQLTKESTVLRTEHRVSPDGAFIAHTDYSRRLFLYDTKAKTERLLEGVQYDNIDTLVWSPDSRWLVYRFWPNHAPDHGMLRLYDTKEAKKTDLTTDRYDSHSPTFGLDGKWLFFLSNRNFQSLARSPWGARQPEPFFERQTQIFALGLQPGLRPPFQEEDELHLAAEAAKKKAEAEKKKQQAAAEGEAKAGEKKAGETKAGDKPPTEAGEKKPDDGSKDGAKKGQSPPIEIDTDGIRARIYQLPVPPGVYSDLVATKGHLLWRAMDDRYAKSKHGRFRTDLKALKIGDPKAKVNTRMGDVTSIELTGDGTKLLVRQGKALYVVAADSSAGPKGDALNDARVNLSGWTFTVTPEEEWRQMYNDAWRLHRDYFYDANMHGVDWDAMRQRYAPIAARVRDRLDLRDVIGMLISELSALHASVGGGDYRMGSDQTNVGCLGGRFVRDIEAGGYRLEHIYSHDPDEPATASPLARPDLDIRVGDVLVMINDRRALDSRELGQLLVNQTGRQVRLSFTRKGAEGPIEAIVRPVSTRDERNLRYNEWNYGRRSATEKLGRGRIGYTHIRSMSPAGMAQFARDYYPVHNREGLIIDVRHNGGGNIDSWLLSRLLRKTWMYWSGRSGAPTGGMQYAPRGHMIVLCNERSGSDAEAFSEGFKRLKLGPVLGTRTWGGEIWLSRSNQLADGGVASAGMWGVYGPEGIWMVEGHGVEPDIVVDNLPHAMFNGKDQQLEAAVKHLLERLAREPVPIPQPPPRPDKSVPDNRKK